LSLLLPAALLIGAAWYDYRAEMRLASERVTATTNTLAKHADAVLDSMELVLARVADEMERQSWDKVRAAPDLHQFLEDMRSGLPQVESIFVIDRHGQLAATSRSFPAPVFDAREREYFRSAGTEGHFC
jgi:hypothetical protein